MKLLKNSDENNTLNSDDSLFDEASGSFNIVEHFEEIRDRLIRSILCVGVCWGIGWFLQPSFYVLISDHIKQLLPTDIEYRETFKGIMDPFFLKLNISFFIGLTMSIPYLLGEIWFFVAPGLKKKEKKTVLFALPLSMVFFVFGSFVCYSIMPSALNWLIGFVSEFPGTYIYQEPGSLIAFFVKMMILFGISFQFPLCLMFLIRYGIVRYEALKLYWRHYIAGIFTFSMVLNPSADPVSMLMLALPLSVLFLASMFFAKLMSR